MEGDMRAAAAGDNGLHHLRRSGGGDACRRPPRDHPFPILHPPPLTVRSDKGGARHHHRWWRTTGGVVHGGAAGMHAIFVPRASRPRSCGTGFFLPRNYCSMADDHHVSFQQAKNPAADNMKKQHIQNQSATVTTTTTITTANIAAAEKHEDVFDNIDQVDREYVDVLPGQPHSSSLEVLLPEEWSY